MAAITMTVDIPRLTEMIGTSTEPTTENDPLIPHAHTKKCSFLQPGKRGHAEGKRESHQECQGEEERQAKNDLHSIGP